MAQYQRNFYGTSYYGETNAFSGTYESAVIFTEEPLNNTFEVNIKALMPSATYGHSAADIIRTGTWETTLSNAYIRSSKAGNKLEFSGTCDHLNIKYQSRPNGSPVINVKVTTTLAGANPVVKTYTINANSTSIEDKAFSVDGLSYGHQKVEISIPTANAANQYFYFKEIAAKVCSFTIETRARTNGGVWTEYVSIPLTKTLVSGDRYTVKGVTGKYTGHNEIQAKIWMASSDNNISPVIEELILSAGDTQRRTENATYIVQVNMEALASSRGSTFRTLTKLDWSANTPDKTKVVIRTRGTNDSSKTVWGAKSAPYIKGTKRLRLKEGQTQGSLITGLINPASINNYLRIDQWNEWSDSSYLPQDQSDVSITYSFLNSSNAVVYRINQPSLTTKKTFLDTTIGTSPFKIKIDLARRFDKATPVVDSLSLTSTLIYEEDHIVENFKFSSVNNNNTGEQKILNMQDIAYTVPSEATAPVYYLIDNTERPLDVSLYLESTRDLPPNIARPNHTLSNSDKIWAKVKVNATPWNSSATGLLKHYQYGGSSVVYGSKNTAPMATSFTPALKDQKQYRYFIYKGWIDPETGIVQPSSVNDVVNIYWKTEEALLEESKLNWTDKSSHNAILNTLIDKSSDSIIAEVSEESTWGEVEWVSEEKIFFGSCNRNDDKEDYIRKHTTPESGDSLDISYTVQAGNTYQSISEAFGIDTEDLVDMNKNVPLSEGLVILIPSKIVLPKINPLARITNNPYRVDIIHNSVMQGGRIVPDNRIDKIQMTVQEEEVTIVKEAVTRGTIANGMDFLKNPKVTAIVGIWTLANDPILAPNYQSGLDYIKEGNAIDWSPTSSSSKEPASGTTYYVSYKCLRPKTVFITIGSSYKEEGGINRIWRSPEVKAFKGTCSPGVDDKQVLPLASTWQGADDSSITNLEYIIEDNDLWVKSWIEYDVDLDSYVAIGSLQDRIPKDNWFPTIQTGYYYLGKDEYYLYSEPTVVKPEASEIAFASNIEYVQGKYNNAALFQKTTTNIIKNSGFELKTKGVIQKITFFENPNNSGNGVAELGITR